MGNSDCALLKLADLKDEEKSVSTGTQEVGYGCLLVVEARIVCCVVLDSSLLTFITQDGRCLSWPFCAS